LEHFLDQGKHIAFFVIEVSAAGVQGHLQPGSGLRDAFDGSHFLQEPVEFLVVMVNASMSVVILQDMFHRDVREIVLFKAVVMEQASYHPAQQSNFLCGFDIGKHTFNLVEDRQEHSMLRLQLLQDRHVGECKARVRKVNRCLPT
jgi:hypothetical protein